MSFGNYVPPALPVNPLTLRNADNFIKDVSTFQRFLRDSIKEKGYKGIIYVDLPGGQTLQLASMNTPAGAENPSTIIIVGHDSEKRETHVITTYENVALRVVIDKQPEEQAQPQE